jgi:hypothetical protein
MNIMNKKAKTVRDCREEFNKSLQDLDLFPATNDIKGVGVTPNPEVIKTFEEMKTAPLKEAVETNNNLKEIKSILPDKKQRRVDMILTSIIGAVSGLLGGLLSNLLF